MPKQTLNVLGERVWVSVGLLEGTGHVDVMRVEGLCLGFYDQENSLDGAFHLENFESTGVYLCISIKQPVLPRVSWSH